MDYREDIEKLTELAEQDGDWETALEELTNNLDCEDAVELMREFFQLSVGHDVNPRVLIQILIYGEEKYFDCSITLDWETAMFIVSEYGTRRAFRLFFQEKPEIDERKLYEIILTGAAQGGTEGLRDVITWLGELDDLQEITQLYIWAVDMQHAYVSTQNAKILRELFRRTQTTLYDYEYHVGGPVEKWGSGAE